MSEPAELFFFCKLHGPRPTFIQDMTEDERALMQAHAAYWMEAMKNGKVVVFGPVADPAGPWGLGVVRFADEQEMRDFTQGDPVIAANIGFRCETLPMLRAILPAR